MRKTIYFSFSTLMLVITFFACSSAGGETPSATVEEFGKYMKSGDYDKVLDLMDLGEDIPESQLKLTRQFFSSTMEIAAEEMKEQNGGLKKIEAISETIAEDGNSASVVTKTTFENGESEEGNMDLVRVDGKWKLKTGL